MAERLRWIDCGTVSSLHEPDYPIALASVYRDGRRWTAIIAGERIGRYPTRSAAKRAVRRALREAGR